MPPRRPRPPHGPARLEDRRRGALSPNHPAELQLRPDAVLEDDRADRGILFFCFQANLARGFEFVKTQWINERTFFGKPPRWTRWSGRTRGPGCSPSPQQPIRRRLTELPRFVVNRGGEYLFMPGLQALRWIADLGDASGAAGSSSASGLPVGGELAPRTTRG